jgi:hypothetical protein
VYVVAPLTAGIEYVLTSPGQTFVLPPVAVIVPGVDGTGEMVTFSELAALVPQLFTACMPIAPPVADVCTVMELVTALPVQPNGNVQM